MKPQGESRASHIRVATTPVPDVVISKGSVGYKCPYHTLTSKEANGKPMLYGQVYASNRPLQAAIHGAIPYTVNCFAPPTYTCPLATVGIVNLIAVPAVSRVPA